MIPSSSINDHVTIEHTLNGDFDIQLPHMMQHIITGELKKGKYYGIHFFKSEHHQIREITKPPNQDGIWEANINVKHPRTKVWGKKEKPSTFFPLHWQEETLIAKLQEAYSTRKKIFSYKSIGQTSCGIKIAFFTRNQHVVSCFPIYVAM